MTRISARVSETTIKDAQDAVQRLKEDLAKARNDPAFGNVQRQKCLNAFNAANREWQRLMAVQMQDMAQAYDIDKDAAQNLVKPLKDLQETLAAIDNCTGLAADVLNSAGKVIAFAGKFAV